MEEKISNYHIYQQPIETKVKAEIKTNAKGEIQPEVEISISRKLENTKDVFTIISADIEDAVKKVKEALNNLK